MDEYVDFVDRIVKGFESLRSRPAFELLTGQFEAGDLSFIVDRQGIRIHLDQIELSEPEMTDPTDLDS
jgi:multidrug resistance efflux pump